MKQKILYLSIKDLKELGLLKKRGKKKGKRRIYKDKYGNVIRSSSEHMFSSYTNTPANMSSNANIEKYNNLLLKSDEQINDNNRFKIALDNKISSITDVQNADRKTNQAFMNQAGQLYNDNIIPLINKNKGYKRGDGIDVSIGNSSDNFKTTNTNSRFNMNNNINTLEHIPIPMAPINIIHTNRFGWATNSQETEKAHQPIDEDEEEDEEPNTKLKSDLEELRTEQPNNNNANTVGGGVIESSSYNHINRIPSKESRSTISEIREYAKWYLELCKDTGSKVDNDIKNESSSRTPITRAIIKILKKQYKNLEGLDSLILNYKGNDPNVIDKAIGLLKFNAKNTPF